MAAIAEKNDNDYRYTRTCVVSFSIVICFVLIVTRLFYIQVIMGPSYVAIAEAQQSKNVSLAGERGMILDKNGEILARNIEKVALFVDPTAIRNKKRVARRISKSTGISLKYVSKKLKSSGRYVPIGMNIDWNREDEIKKLTSAINSQSVKSTKKPALFYSLESRRVYPGSGFLSHILGFALRDNRGLEGIEKVYDNYLNAEKNSVIYEKDAYGKRLFPKNMGFNSRNFGNNIVLNIDEVIQHFAETALDDVMAKTGAKSATVTIMDPMTGNVMAMAVRPGFDPNSVSDYSISARRNRVVTDIYEPGSTFKIVIAAALLEEKLVGLDDLIDLEDGVLRIGRVRIRDSHKMTGEYDFAKIFQVSSNIGMIKAAARMEPEQMYSYIKRFGFGERTGIDLLGEVSGILHHPDKWSKTTMPSMSMGQGIAVTPLQLITAASAVINGGYLMKPHVVMEIQDYNGVTIRKFSPEIRRRIISEETSIIMRELLAAVVEEGTGRKAAIKGYRVGGKTGTSQKIDPQTRRYSHTLVVSSFIGFAPVDDPKLIVLVTVDEPEGVHWGGTIAAPVVKNILERSLRYLMVPKSKEKPLLPVENHRT